MTANNKDERKSIKTQKRKWKNRMPKNTPESIRV